MELRVLDMNGTQQSSYELPDEVFNEPLNQDLLYQVVTVLDKRQQEPVAHTKDRSQRRGGGSKPWRQKGTGRARHGSRRSPIWRKGGVTFGPTNERNPNTRITKKMKRKTMRMVLSSLVANEELFVLDSIRFDSMSTKQGKQMLEKVLPQENDTLVILPEADENIEKSLRNLDHVTLVSVESVSLEDLMKHDFVLTDRSVIDILSEKYRG
ncbi:MAG: 50S ribosomal protein L4 [Parcubacteria group bacterium SW_4_49_11]|nr:MAG: 50S ribosomal protein L4 [Parcubacteria group bacterium SW_4_49_11]